MLSSDFDQRMDNEHGSPGRGNLRPNHYDGHTFSLKDIRGGAVHLGDTYYATDGHHVRRASTEWLARPTSSHVVGDEDRLYIVPRLSTFQFTGRHLETNMIQQYLSRPLSPTNGPRHNMD